MTSKLLDAALTQERSISMDYLRCLMNPRQYNVMPDSAVETANSISQAVDYSMNYTVKAPAPTNNSLDATFVPSVPSLYYSEQCAPNEGLILILPKYGPLAIAHMGFVKAGASVPLYTIKYGRGGPGQSGNGTVNPINVRGLTLYRNYAPGPVMATPTSTWVALVNSKPAQNSAQFDWTGTVALPRTGNGAIHVGPNMDANFSRLRMYAGIVQLEGNTASLTAGSISGAVSSSVLADTRAVANVVANGSTPGSSYAISSLAQQSVFRGDVVKSIKLTEGVTTVVGPDYNRSYGAPNPLTVTRRMGEKTTRYVNLTSSSAATGCLSNVMLVDVDTTAQALVPQKAFSAFVTPWTCDFRIDSMVNNGVGAAPLSVTSTSALHNNINIGPIDEMGSLDIQLNLSWYAYVNTVSGAQHVLQIVNASVVVQWIHFFCNINDNGTVNYNMFPEKQESSREASQAAWQSVIGGTDTFNTNRGPPSIFSTSAAKFRTSFSAPDGGKYVGTYCMVSFHVGPYTDTFPATMILNIKITEQPQFTVSTAASDEIGAVGPAHIIRYDGVGLDQELILRGMSLNECTTLGNLAPFAQQSIPRQLSVSNPNIQLMVKELFSSSPYFKRCMSTVEYNSRIVPYIDSMTSQKLLLDSHDNHRLAIAVRASGLIADPEDDTDENKAGNRRQREQ